MIWGGDFEETPDRVEYHSREAQSPCVPTRILTLGCGFGVVRMNRVHVPPAIRASERGNPVALKPPLSRTLWSRGC